MIIPQAGLADIVASRSGVIANLYANVGSSVEAGSPVVAIAGDTAVAQGALATLQLGQMRQRMSELDVQMTTQAAQAAAQRDRLLQRIAASRQEIARLRVSLGYQPQQLELSEKQLNKIEPLVRQGYMSELERDRRAQAVLSQRQSIEDLNRAIESREADVHDIQGQIAELDARAETERSQLRSAKSTLAQGLDEVDAQGRSIVNAPIRGRVAALRVHVGTPVAAGAVLATISPAGRPMQAEIFIPTRAAGFISEGQPVRLMVDAFPYQRFGLIEGVVKEVQRAPQALTTGGPPSSEPPITGYKALVAIPQPYIVAYGQKRTLESGMSATVDIVTGRKTLLQSALDPLKSVLELRVSE